ncbi:hypothetical protein R5R35_000526 [Gryllus longicercus]|uniref:Uncharacterized protein n=1 Tax=Gryllus longicercus TaxID=2509291 RepID=A0AAN9VV27_9ORTH
MDFCEGGGGGDARHFGEAAVAPPPTPAQARSPASPERQFCSSTTQPMGHADKRRYASSPLPRLWRCSFWFSLWCSIL